MRSTVLLLLLFVSAWGPPYRAAQSAEKLGRIEGIMFLEETDEPVSDASIALLPVVPTAASKPGSTPTPPPRTTLSNRAGRFVFDGLQPGDYTVRASRDGYFNPTEPGGGVAIPGAIVPATVTAGQTSEVRLPMILGGAISGRVLDANGRPAAQARVQALRLGYQPDGAPILQSMGEKPTDDRGEFRHYFLAPGTYYLAVTPNATGSRGRGGTGTPQEIPVRTLYPGVLDIAEARPLTLASGAEIEGANVDIRSATFAKISGKVSSTLPVPAALPTSPTQRDAGNPALQTALQAALQTLGQGRTAVQLQLVSRDRGTLQDPGLSARTMSTTLGGTNDGRFELQNIPPGSYVLYASIAGNTDGDPSQNGSAGMAYGRAAVDVGTTDVDGVAITIHRGVDVTGRVFTDGDRSILSGMNISLQVVDSAASLSGYQQFGRNQFRVSEDGRFTIPTLPEATYRVQVSFGSGTTAGYLVGVRQGDAEVFGSEFVVGDGRVVPLDVFVSVASGSVAGRVLDAGGRPIANAVVTLAPPPERRNNAALYRTVSADADGKFLLTGVPPGEFKLFAWRRSPAGAGRNAAFLARYEKSGLPITIVAGGEVRAEVALATEPAAQ